MRNGVVIIDFFSEEFLQFCFKILGGFVGVCGRITSIFITDEKKFYSVVFTSWNIVSFSYPFSSVAPIELLYDIVKSIAARILIRIPFYFFQKIIRFMSSSQTVGETFFGLDIVFYIFLFCYIINKFIEFLYSLLFYNFFDVIYTDTLTTVRKLSGNIKKEFSLSLSLLLC